MHPASDDYPKAMDSPSRKELCGRAIEGLKARLMEAAVKAIDLSFLRAGCQPVPAGHRIQIYVASNFPNFDINRNTGDPTGHDRGLARNLIHHDAERPDYVELPLEEVGELIDCSTGQSHRRVRFRTAQARNSRRRTE